MSSMPETAKMPGHVPASTAQPPGSSLESSTIPPRGPHESYEGTEPRMSTSVGGGPMSGASAPHDPPMPRYRRRFAGNANPAPLGLLSFALLWWNFGLILIRTRGIGPVGVANGIIPLALSLGFVMMLAGIGCFFRPTSNTWGVTFHLLYGAFWVSLALFWVPFFNVLALDGSFLNSLGVFYSSWLIISVLFTISTMGTSLIVFSMFCVLDLVYLLLMVTAFTTGTASALQKAAGAFSILVSALAAYAGLSALMTQDIGPLSLPTFELGRKED